MDADERKKTVHQ